MKKLKRGLALLLTMAMFCSLLAPAAAVENSPAATAATASLSATLRFDYVQRIEEVAGRNIKVTLSRQGGVVLGEYNLSTGQKSGFQNLTVERTVKNQDGGLWSNEPQIGYYDLHIDGLPAEGHYALAFTGEGYADYTIDNITFDHYSKQYIVGTQGGTFAVGDVNGDHKVTIEDRDLLSGALGQAPEGAFAGYDLNGDGKIDIIDLAYVNHNIGAEGGMEMVETAMIAAEQLFDAAETTQSVGLYTLNGDTVPVGNLFQPGSAVKVTAHDKDAPLALPIVLNEPMELSQIEFTSPEGEGAIMEGTATIEVEGGDGITVPLNQAQPAGIDFLSTGSVVINLGKRVPVKKITITVTQVEGQDGNPKYAVLEEIKFLKDIVPENPVPPFSKVANILATEGNEQVTLKWPELPNWSGYRVKYGTAPGTYTFSIDVDVPTAEITDLDNLTTYYFIVTPINDMVGEEMLGQASDEISATPQPSAIPDKPDHTTVSAMDGALRLTWGKSKNATFYHVYYKPSDAGSYTQVPGDLKETAYTVAGLTNGTEYSLYVTACNAIGESKPGAVVLGTPAGLENKEPAGIPTGGRMDRSNIASITMTDPGNYDVKQYPNGGFKIQNVADGDYSTHWTSQSHDSGNWSRNKTLTFTFKEPMDMSYVVWVPRQDGGYRNNLRLYTITVYDTAGKATVVASDRQVKGSPGATGYAVLPFAPTEGIQKISIKIEQQAYTAVSLSEIIFFAYDREHDLNQQIESLFTDGSMTAIKDTVTAEQIAALEQQIARPEIAAYYFSMETLKDELSLAKALLGGDQSKLGAITDGIQSRSGSAAGNEGQGGSTLQPLGAVSAAGKEISIYASGIPAGETVNVVATQFDAEASAWQASLGKLENGRNVLTVPKIGSQASPPRGGSLYLTYTGTQGDQIKIQVRRATSIPVLELSDLNLNTQADAAKARIGQYVSVLEAYLAGHTITDGEKQYLNSTEISLPHVLLSIPAQPVAKTLATLSPEEKVEHLYQNALAWEQVMEITCKTQGIDDNSAMESRQNIRYMQMFAGAFMYAAGSHVGVGYGSCSGLVCGKPIETMQPDAVKNQLFGWGIAHEIGHNMDKLGKAEITNNIYSLMVQTYDGNANTLTSRLESSTKYDGIFNKVAVGYPGASNDVFVQLGMYWQLHLAFDSAEEPMHFYNEFFKLWKQGGLNSAYTYDEKVAVTASKVAGQDLSAFFTRWGMRLGDAALAEVKACGANDGRAIWYLNDQSRRLRLKQGGQSQGAGSVTLNAAADSKDPRQVHLTFSMDPAQDLQGYEIRRNDKAVAFTTGAEYIDLIGSANNQAFRYTVAAYDKLGYEVAVSDPVDVLVAYDKTIDPAIFDMTRDADGTIHFQVKAGTQVVSGFKIAANAPASGAYSVTVTGKQDGKAVVARAGSFETGNLAAAGGQYLAYLNRPGVSSQDTRIWPYEVKEVTITGIPASVADADIQLISYAGDHVAFQEDLVMAKLGKAYQYTDLKGNVQTLAEGAVVILGSYRGDPVYNVVNINGEYVTLEEDKTDDQVLRTDTHTVPGTVLMLAEVPESGPVCDISDGFFIFIPGLIDEKGKPLLTQDQDPACTGSYGLPARIQAQIFRLNDPTDTTKGKGLTGSTLWVDVPSLDSLPVVTLEGEEVKE